MDQEHSSKTPKGDEYDEQWKALGAWFLGPRAENKDVFIDIFSSLLEAHTDLRNSYFPTDPAYINHDIRQSEAFKMEVKQSKDKLLAIADELKNSVPFFSPRYQGHMCWDVTMPSLLGYMVAVLSNQNNVDTAASSVTTVFEQKVGLQLCHMLGYNVDEGYTKGWGHITCGGSVANIESLWAARNIKFSALAVQYAVVNVPSHIMNEQEKDRALAFQVTVGVETKCTESCDVYYQWIPRALGDCTTRQLLNLDIDEFCDLTRRVALAAELSGTRIDDFGAWVEKCSYASMGIQKFMELHHIEGPVYTCPANCHYSWPKGGTLLGLGSDALIEVPLDIDFRQDITVLEDKLVKIIEEELQPGQPTPVKHRPILQVVAVIGSTEESAVDPILKIWHLRQRLKMKYGVNFSIHADAAWGGYFKTMLITEPVKERISHKSGYMPFTPLTDYVSEQYSNIQKADTITIDPHKSGFCPYPAGALCYRNEAMRYFIAIMHPEVFHGKDDPTMGVYGIEGSKPGAAPTAVLASHEIVGLDIYGYGRILGQCTTTCKLFWCLWQTLARPGDPFVCQPLQLMPEKFNVVEPDGQIKGIRIIKEKILGKHISEVAKDEEAMDLLRLCGPDTIINTFVVNLKNEDGSINHCVKRSNDLQKAISDDLNVMVGSNAQRVPMVIMQSGLSSKHGLALTEYKKRLGLHVDDQNLNVMVNTTMNPWQWNESIAGLGDLFRGTILNCIGKLNDPRDIFEFVLCGPVDADGTVFAEFIPSFSVPARQYQIVVKFKLATSSHRAKKGMFVKSAYPLKLEEFLCKPDKNGVEFSLLDQQGELIEQVNLVVLDVPFYQHFDMSIHAAHNEHQVYRVYGDEKRTYMTHCIKKAPDFMQVVELDDVPFGMPKDVKEIGVDVTLSDSSDMSGEPKTISGKVVDPLDNHSYPIVYRGREYALCKSTAYFQHRDAKVFFLVLE